MERVYIVLSKILRINVDCNSFIALAVTSMVMHKLIMYMY